MEAEGIQNDLDDENHELYGNGDNDGIDENKTNGDNSYESDHNENYDNIDDFDNKDDSSLISELRVTPQELKAVRNILKVANDLMDPNSTLRRNKPFVHEVIHLNQSGFDNAGRKYLFWNSIGTITSRNDNDYSQKLEIHFHNTRGANKDFSIVDIDEFTIAAMSDEGVIFANQIFGDKNNKRPNLFYYPFLTSSTSSSNESFKAKMCDDERVLSVAMGKGWIAVASSANTLRIFSSSGIPLRTATLSGRPVCLCGLNTKLAVILQVCETKALQVNILDIFWDLGLQKVVDVAKDIGIPLSNSSTLCWVAFSKDWFMLTILDSQGRVSMLSKTSVGVLGWNWSQVLDLGINFRTSFWPISVQKQSLNYIPLAEGHQVPQRNFNQLYPAPKQKEFVFRLLQLSKADKYFSAGEMQQFAWENLIMIHLETLRADLIPSNESSGESLDFNQLDLLITEHQAKFDRIILEKMQLSIVSQQTNRAVDLVCIIRGVIGLESARKMGNHFKCPDVTEMAERYLRLPQQQYEVDNNNESESSAITERSPDNMKLVCPAETTFVLNVNTSSKSASSKKESSISVPVVSSSLKLFAAQPVLKTNKSSWLNELGDLIVVKKLKT